MDVYTHLLDKKINKATIVLNDTINQVALNRYLQDVPSKGPATPPTSPHSPPKLSQITCSLCLNHQFPEDTLDTSYSVHQLSLPRGRERNQRKLLFL